MFFQYRYGNQVKQKLTLDKIPGCVLAVGLKKLKSNNSSDLRIRRSSDSLEQDFGFVSNNFDSSSALTFCGSSDGLVSKAYDLSGNNNHAISSVASEQPVIISAGAYNNGMTFDMTKRLAITSNSNISFTSAFTIIAKINPTTLGELSAGRIVDKATNYGFNLASSNRLSIQGSYNSANNAITLGVDQIVAVRFDKTLALNQIEFIVNGVNKGYGTKTDDFVASTETLYIGERSQNNCGFDGKIYGVAMFNRRLSDSELTTIYGAF